MIVPLALALSLPPPILPATAAAVIHNAANGGLRDWLPVPGSRGELYVRDRTERRYRVTLSKGCTRHAATDAIVYTTDATGTFDRFSTVRFVGARPMLCGVVGIADLGGGEPPQLAPSRRHF